MGPFEVLYKATQGPEKYRKINIRPLKIHFERENQCFFKYFGFPIFPLEKSPKAPPPLGPFIGLEKAVEKAFIRLSRGLFIGLCKAI